MCIFQVLREPGNAHNVLDKLKLTKTKEKGNVSLKTNTGIEFVFLLKNKMMSSKVVDCQLELHATSLLLAALVHANEPDIDQVMTLKTRAAVIMTNYVDRKFISLLITSIHFSS